MYMSNRRDSWICKIRSLAYGIECVQLKIRGTTETEECQHPEKKDRTMFPYLFKFTKFFVMSFVNL